jgi:poly-gamma-glutamate capsule biosynthesis protein CapA/YwtB (metallophosphatase superfamily)
MNAGHVLLALAGDAMLGRGLDQILPRPGDPRLEELVVTDARRYVALAEAVNGPIPRPVRVDWPWGEALTVLDEAQPDARLINLETAVTRSDDFAPGKPVCYRLSPANVGAVVAGRPDVCVLANNHVLDFGVAGLKETVRSLAAAGLTSVGAGHDRQAAERPAEVPLAGARLLTFACAMDCSGVPPTWAAGEGRPGVAFLRCGSRSGVGGLAERIDARRGPGDLVVVSVHWGTNWGDEVPRAHRRVAHELIDAGADVVHGHSSHHPRPIELHRERLVLYGCGDLINDYEGIPGHASYRPDLRALYLVHLQRGTGALAGIRVVPLRARRMRLEQASAADAAWLRERLDRVSRPFGARFHLEEGDLALSSS